HMPWTVITRGRNRFYLTKIAIRCWLDPSPESLLLNWRELCHQGEEKANARFVLVTTPDQQRQRFSNQPFTGAFGSPRSSFSEPHFLAGTDSAPSLFPSIKASVARNSMRTDQSINSPSITPHRHPSSSFSCQS